MIFASLQVHQTRTALVTLADCDGTTDYVVGISALYSICVLESESCSPELSGPRDPVEKSPTVPDCGALCHSCRMALHDFLDQAIVCRIWVRCFFDSL